MRGTDDLARTPTNPTATWEAVFRHTTSGIAVTDPGSRLITLVNDSFARMHGYPPEELIGVALEKLVCEQRPSAAAPGSWRAGAAAGSRIYRSVHRRRDHSLFHVEVEEVEVARPDGGSYAVLHVRDVTDLVADEEERRRFEEQVRHTQKLESLGVLAGGIAHDFNNLLMGILANAELALRLLPTETRCRHHLEQVRETALRAGELANQMLAYSGRSHVQVRPLGLNEVVREIGDLLRVSLSKKVTLRYGFQPDLPPIDGDPVQLRQVVMNLITNASDAIGDEVGVITVTTGTIHVDRGYLPEVADRTGEGTYVFVEVRDNGGGMNEQTLGKIFEPFFTTKLTGRGLGLAAVFGILRAHRGAIHVHTRPGEGTTFCVLFPRTRNEGGAHSHSTMPPTALSATILVAEDEDGVRHSLAEMLQLVGCTVIEARDGREAVKLFDKHVDEVSAVLLDLTMPELNGRQVFAELQKRRLDVPVIVMSGYAEGEIEEGFGRGAGGRQIDFLQKPIPMARLLSTVRKVLDQSREDGDA